MFLSQEVAGCNPGKAERNSFIQINSGAQLYKNDKSFVKENPYFMML